jgi:hypothetical protein
VCNPYSAVEQRKFYKVKEVSELLRQKPDWVRRHFADVNGVLHLGERHSGKRRYDPILIPGSILLSWIANRSTRPLTSNRFTNRRK